MTTNDMHQPIIIFLPETGIEPYIRNLALLADAARKPNQEVFLTMCSGDLTMCSMMNMHRIPYADVENARKIVCPICRKKLQEVCDEYNFIPLDLKGYTSDFDPAIVSALADESSDLLELEHKDLPIGTLAAYDFSLATKYIYSAQTPIDMRFIMETYIKNTSTAIDIAVKLFEEFKPASVLIFNEYSSYAAVKLLAMKQQIPCITTTAPMHKGVSGHLVFCHRHTFATSMFYHYRNWPQYYHLPISPAIVEECWDNVFFRSYGHNSHIFSPNKGKELEILIEELDIDINKKICLVCTSSEEELYGLESMQHITNTHPGHDRAFNSQIEWLQNLQEFAAQNDSVQFIVRVHPREGAKKRKGYAEHLLALQQTFTENTKNFKIIWPEDPISTYDLLEFADIVLIAWTAMGAEAAMLGIPVLGWAGSLHYYNSPAFNIATTKEAFRLKLIELINKVTSLAQLKDGLRYYHWKMFVPYFNFSETVNYNFYAISYWPRVPQNFREEICSIVQGDVESPIEYNIKRWRASLHENSEQEETKAILDGIKAFVEVIFFPPKMPTTPSFLFRVYRKLCRVLLNKNVGKPFKLPQVTDYSHLAWECHQESVDNEKCMQRTLNDKNLRIVIIQGMHVVYYAGGVRHQRTSKLIRNLAMILLNARV